MQQQVLVIEDSAVSLKLLTKLVRQANLTPVTAASLTEARIKFDQSTPENYLCAVVDYHLPDAPNGEAIDFAIASYLPTIVITGRVDNETRDAVLARQVVDYIPKENAQVYDYLSRLLTRMERNKHIGVLVVDPLRVSRHSRAELLQRHHFQTYEAASAAEAFNALNQHDNIRLMLLDDSIRDQVPTQMVADLRKSYSKDELAIIGIGAGDSALMAARFIKSGASDFFRAPYCHEEFLCRINQNLELIEHVAAIREAANQDYLTGLPNRRHFFYTVNQIKRRTLTEQALALLDLDHFKQVNDSYGHDAGDAVLKAVATQLAIQFGECHVARFGGEEFCIYFPNLAKETVVQKLESFRRSIEALTIPFDNHAIRISTSIGVTCTPQNNIEAMLATADSLLYRAKHNGRNRIVSDLES